MAKPTTPLIVIVGETASGKSAVALELAKLLNGEIICADSRTIYKNMDIGTAKPSLEDQALVSHHMLNIVKPNEDFNASLFQKMATKIINDIWDRGKWPIMVGGTGLYVDSVVFNYKFRAKDSAKRKLLESKSLEELVNIARSNNLDVSDPKNKRYLVRLLESNQNSPSNRHTLRPNTLIMGLRVDRTDLRERIVSRVEKMFKLGLRREVEDLLKTYSWQDPGMTSIGYREFKEYYIEGLSMTKVKQKIVYSTLQFAKRQRTWFKRNRNIYWTDNSDDVKKVVQEFTSKHLNNKTV
jgi:tRNA dimethylallyltransferase